MNQESYLIKDGEFWHCELVALAPVTLQIRTGKLNQNWELGDSIASKLHRFMNIDKAVESISNLIKQRMRLGFSEVDPAQIVRVTEQQSDGEQIEMAGCLQQFSQFNQPFKTDISKKQQMNEKYQKKKINKIRDQSILQPTKPIVSLTNEALSGNLIGTWPKHKNRVKLGETHDLGPQIPSEPRACLLADQWDKSIEPTGYFLSEKLDGMRILWSGSEMFTRNGHSINFPPFFVEGWPTTYLDGELWLERGKFQKLLSITKKKLPDEKAWEDIKYMVFDAPLLQEPFSERYQKFKKVIEKIKNPYLVYVPHILCQSRQHLAHELTLVQAIGGEGLMLRDPESLYEAKRSQTLLKVKSSQDAEATIIGYSDGNSKLQGSQGALRVITKEGVEFVLNAGMKMNFRKSPPKIGTVITYRYYGVTDDGKPRFPVFERVCPNL